MKALLKKGSRIVLLLVCFSILLAPIAVVHAGEEDIPRIFSMTEPIITTTPEVFLD